jgi:hypothetical protein
MRTLGKMTAGLLAIALLSGCTKSEVNQNLQVVGWVPIVAVVGAAEVTGVGPLIRAAAAPHPLEKMSPSKSFPGDPKAQALAAAAEKGDVTEIDKLVDAGADVNAVGAYGLTISEWLLFHPNKDGFRRLLERGADPNKITQWTGPNLDLRTFEQQQSSLVHWAAYRTPQIGPDYLRMVLEIGKGNPNLEPPDRQARPLMKALGKDNGAAFCLLRSHGAELEFFTVDGETPIVAAAGRLHSNFRLVDFMLAQGVSFSYAAPAQPALGGLHAAVQHALENSGARQPFDPEFPWLWRCVDFLEQRGLSFEYVSRSWGPALRPVTVGNPPIDLLAPDSEPHALSRRVAVYGVVLTIPRPYWSRTPGDATRIGCRTDEEGKGYVYKYYREGNVMDPFALRMTLQKTTGEAFPERSRSAIKNFESNNLATATLLEQSSERAIYRIVRADKTAGYMYLGLCNGTFVTFQQFIKKSDQSSYSADDAYVLQGMREIALAAGEPAGLN